jgi:23S rRNA (adenine2503-C2)-methyltransferase
MNHILALSADELEAWLIDHDQPSYRAKQIVGWLYRRRAAGFEEMTDLPIALREQLASCFQVWTTQIVAHRVADDGTEKLLLQLADGGQIECVLLRDGSRRTICISTQVGCAMGCVFCASGLDGVQRNLTAGEIVEQMLRLARLLPGEERLSHIVVMGMGEPLANLGALRCALRQANHPEGLGISVRRITISTVGLPRAIRQLAEEATSYHLAVSLHAPNDALRNQLVPINRRTGLQEILEAADHYFEASGRRLTFEYVLLGDVNDRAEHAHQLVELLRGRPALVNVIPYNPVAGLSYRTPGIQAQNRFRTILEQGGLQVQFRQRKGERIDAACGQLRRHRLSAGPGETSAVRRG